MVKISSIRWMPVRTTLWGRGVLLFTLLALGSCSTNPAAPPAPPAELPSFLTLPDPTISVAEISHQASPDLSALVGSGPLAAEISVAPDLIQETNDALLALISNLNAQFQIPVSALTKTFEAPVSIGSGDTARTVDGKIDFADFDFDGDGSKEGCSGSTAPLPNGDVRICMRLWLDGHKVLAGLFKQYPAPGAPGAGRITVFSNPSLGEAEAGASFAFKYDFLDLTNRKTEFFSGITDNADPTTFVALRHTLVSQVGTEGSAQKSINFTDAFKVEGSTNPMFLDYLGEFRQDADFWSGSVDGDDTTLNLLGLSRLHDACARISGGDPVLQGTCQDFGIDVDDTPFTTFASPTDPLLPADFPETPTF